MADRVFTLATEPHLAHIGEYTLSFRAELYGSELLDGHARLTAVQERLKDKTDPESVKQIVRAVREFLASLMTPECAADFLAVDTITQTSALDGVVTTKTVDRIQLPHRVLSELMEWVMEVHGGGSSARPTT